MQGETLQGVRIRHSTMMGYIKQAMQLHEHWHVPNTKSADINYIKIMTDAVENCEEVPKN